MQLGCQVILTVKTSLTSKQLSQMILHIAFTAFECFIIVRYPFVATDILVSSVKLADSLITIIETTEKNNTESH